MFYSHTSFSDAEGSSVLKQAYEYGKRKDWIFAVTDHSTFLDGKDFGEYNSWIPTTLWKKKKVEWQKTGQQKEENRQSNYFAGRGFEMTSSAANGGENYGHINVV